MKTLLLLSSGTFLKNDLSDIFEKPLNKYRMAHIIDSSKGKGVTNTDHIERVRDRFKEREVYFEDIELAGKNENEVREIMKNFDGVFVNGGSTFYLLKVIRETGFDKVLKELLPKGFIYIGASAGSYVACPSIEMALWGLKDRYDRYGITDLTGMNLVPFLMRVHYVPEYRDLLKQKISQANYPVKILTDEQAILVKGDSFELLGGEEVSL